MKSFTIYNSQLTILLLFLTLTAFGQVDSGFTNKAEAKNLMVNGLKEGKWVEYPDTVTRNEDNMVRRFYYLTVYKEGKPYGISRIYGFNGILERETAYRDGELNGKKIEYNSNGAVLSEESYTNGKRDGVFKNYYSNGKLESEITYVNGKKTGTKKTYYESGELKSEETYSDGKKNTKHYYYYEDGKIKRQITYVDGNAVGEKNYGENGNEIK